jgi:hypothetical protein
MEWAIEITNEMGHICLTIYKLDEEFSISVSYSEWINQPIKKLIEMAEKLYQDYNKKEEN